MSGFDPEMVTQWQAAVGREETSKQHLDAESLRRYALAVGSDGEVERVQPPLAHWAFFLPEPSDDMIGTDGHPRRGGFLPAITLPRRMFAASDITFGAPLLIGQKAEQTSRIVSVAPKSGRSGDLVFVEVERTIIQFDLMRISERQSYVYRGDGDPVALPDPADPSPEGEVWFPEEVNLFRFSAATFNGHRIHYDRPYATDVEGYPSLVVHGPFTAARLTEFAARTGELASFSFRAQSPLFLGQPIRLQRIGDDEVRAIRCDGATAMAAKVTYR
jgi:3-methylfumaryl-CoA hydratase